MARFRFPHLLPWLVLALLVIPLASASAQSFRRGDTNADGAMDISDGVRPMLWLFSGGFEPPCLDASDANDTGDINITDGIYILNFLFLGGPPPPYPYPDCGMDLTSDALSCNSFPACESPSDEFLVNVQVDAELQDVDGLLNLTAALKERQILTTVYVTADYANRNALLISDLFQQGFEIACHGFYTGEQLASMTYEEQLDLLSRAKLALEGCKPCGTYKPIVGFRPQYFSQNEDTYRVLDELGLAYNGGYKVGQIFLPGHEWDTCSYGVDAHAFSAVPLTTVPRGETRIYLCDIACAQVEKMTGAEFGQALQTGLAQSLAANEPLVFLLHNWYTGDKVKYDYWQPVIDLIDQIRQSGRGTFVSSLELVERCTLPPGP